MWTKNEKCRDRFAAFIQHSSASVATRKVPVKLP